MWIATGGKPGPAGWRAEVDWLRLDINPKLRVLELVCGENDFAPREFKDVISVLEYTVTPR